MPHVLGVDHVEHEQAIDRNPGSITLIMMFLDVFSSPNLRRRIFVSAEIGKLASRPTECARSK